MEQQGYIKIFRKMVDWEWFSDCKTLSVYMYLILSANHKDTSWRGMKILRGQTVTSLEKIACRTGLSKRSVRTSIEKLKSTNNIVTKSTNRYSIITICNFGSYQCQTVSDDTQNDTQTDTQTTRKTSPKRHTNDTRTDTKQEEENEENEEKRRMTEKGGDTNVSPDANASMRARGTIVGKNGEQIELAKFIAFWNKTVKDTSVPQIKVFSDARKKMLKARLKEYGKKEIFNAIEKIPQSDFLSGRSTDFRASFDFVFGPKNFPKVIEGNYNNSTNPKSLERSMQVGVRIGLTDGSELPDDMTDYLNPKNYV